MAKADSISTPVEYRDIPGHPGYRVGSDGSVWTCRRQVSLGGGRGTRAVIGDEWRLMKFQTLRAGYPYVKLSGNIKQSVHRLVLLAFVGPCPEGMEACHENGDRTDNRLSNLRWDTRMANSDDRTRHGTQVRGETCGKSKLTDAIVRAARAERAALKTPFYELARKYGVTTGVIHNAVTGKTWGHVA